MLLGPKFYAGRFNQGHNWQDNLVWDSSTTDSVGGPEISESLVDRQLAIDQLEHGKIGFILGDMHKICMIYTSTNAVAWVQQVSQ